MFETVAPQRFETRKKRVAYETLPISVAIHAIAIGAAVVIAAWNVAFPLHSPRLITAYRLAALPEPPFPPIRTPAPPPAPPKQTELPKIRPRPQIRAVIPDAIAIPKVADVAPASLVAAPQVASGDSAAGADGVVDGTTGGGPHGIEGGIPFGDGRVHIARDKPLPLFPVLCPYPDYPEEARVNGIEGTVVVRYIIGTDGWVKELRILEHAKEKQFDEATLEAIRQWRFLPMMKDGSPVEVVHELTVYYQLVYR